MISCTCVCERTARRSLQTSGRWRSPRTSRMPTGCTADCRARCRAMADSGPCRAHGRGRSPWRMRSAWRQRTCRCSWRTAWRGQDLGVLIRGAGVGDRRQLMTLPHARYRLMKFRRLHRHQRDVADTCRLADHCDAATSTTSTTTTNSALSYLLYVSGNSQDR